MSRTHRYFYQVQGQLHVTQRQYCIFAAWTPTYMKQIRVDRDDDFWEIHMKSFLLRFYHECMLPDILDSRYNRNMPIQNPEYISKAMTEVKLKKKLVKLITSEKRKVTMADRAKHPKDAFREPLLRKRAKSASLSVTRFVKALRLSTRNHSDKHSIIKHIASQVLETTSYR